jgi:hypothetical protein
MTDAAQAAEFLAEAGGYIAVQIAINNVNNQYQTLASNYFNDYQAQRNFYFSTFQASGEAPFATEQFGVPFYAPDYVGHNSAFYGGPTGYFPPGAWFFFNTVLTNRIGAIGSSSAFGYWQRYASRYTANGNSINLENSSTFAMESASIVDDWNSYMNRYEEHKRDVWNEKRWADQMGSLSYGVKEAYTVERGLGTAFWQFDEAQGQMISADATLGNGLATFAGYRQMQKSLREDLGTVPDYQDNAFMTNVIPQGMGH